jgi:uncharacterized repeat protein (TIGR02543 family)
MGKETMTRKRIRSAVCWRLGTFLVALAVVVSAGLAAGAASAVVVGAAPTLPVPAYPAVGLPPFPALPAATATTPPADEIGDPVTSGATCGAWGQQSNYAGLWPAASTWWAYRCSFQSHYNTPCSSSGACDALCPSWDAETSTAVDFFYWNGSDAVFYGEDYIYQCEFSAVGDGGPPVHEAWWDAPTDRWYNPGPFGLSVTSEGGGQVSSTPAGIDCGYSCDAAFDAGTVVTLTATPDPGWMFTGWWGDCSGTGSCQVTMDQAQSVYATFDPTIVDLTVSRTGSGSGSVDSNPSGIGCGTICHAGFDAGTVVTLTATPGAGSRFTGWSGDCSGTGSCQVTMDQARSVTATFDSTIVDLTVSRAGSGSGSVASSPAGISCGTGCEAGLDAGTAVTLTATPDAGSLFAGWSGDCSGAGSCQLTMSQARSVTATFAPNLPPHASFTLICTSLACNFDATGSSDPDNGIASFAWNFGDGTSGSGSKPPTHTYAKAGSYTVTLTVTDNAGATAAISRALNPISVSARGYRRNGAQKVDLSWNGASGTSFDVYRNGTRIASLQAFTYTDTLIGKGSYSYKVCAPADSVCSNTASVSF